MGTPGRKGANGMSRKERHKFLLERFRARPAYLVMKPGQALKALKEEGYDANTRTFLTDREALYEKALERKRKVDGKMMLIGEALVDQASERLLVGGFDDPMPVLKQGHRMITSVRTDEEEVPTDATAAQRNLEAYRDKLMTQGEALDATEDSTDSTDTTKETTTNG